MVTSITHNEHYFLEHKEDVAFSFIHDNSVRDVLERHGIDLLFFARHFGLRVVDAVVLALFTQQKSHMYTLLEVMQLFFARYHICLDEEDLAFLRQGFKKTFAKFAMNLDAHDMIFIETMLEIKDKRDFFSIEEIEESKELIEDMEHFSAKISSEEIATVDIYHGIEKLVIITETYGRLLGQKDSCAFLSRKLLDMSLLLRSWSSLVGEEGFFQILDEVKSIIALLLVFQEQALETQCVELNAFDTRVSHDIENIAMILHRSNHDM